MSTLRVGNRQQSTTELYVGNRSFSESLFARPKPVTQTLGWQSNYTVPYHWTIAAWTDDLHKSIMNGQLVFMKNDDAGLKRKKAYTMMNLPMVNYQLYCDQVKLDQQMKQDQQKTPTTDTTTDDADQKVKLINNILKRYSPLGSVINHLNGSTNIQNKAERVINVCISGRQTTFNIWGDVADGDRLYLSLQWTTNVEAEHFNLSVDNMDCPRNHRNHKPTTTDCYQWIPYTVLNWKEQYKHPSANSSGHAQYIYELGRVFRCPRGRNFRKNEEEKQKLAQNLSNMVSKTHMIEVHWDIKCLQ
jgi:hypothetical protein